MAADLFNAQLGERWDWANGSMVGGHLGGWVGVGPRDLHDLSQAELLCDSMKWFWMMNGILLNYRHLVLMSPRAR